MDMPGPATDRGPPAADTGRVPAEPPAQQPAPVVQEAPRIRQPQIAIPRSNPKEELARLGWPNCIDEWGRLQREIWRGHPRLPRPWMRCWSRSQDKEYYLNTTTMHTTFIFSE